MKHNIEVSERMLELIKRIQNLPIDKRHRLTIICRGNEPYEIEKEVTQEKIELKTITNINN